MEGGISWGSIHFLVCGRVFVITGRLRGDISRQVRMKWANAKSVSYLLSTALSRESGYSLTHALSCSLGVLFLIGV